MDRGRVAGRDRQPVAFPRNFRRAAMIWILAAFGLGVVTGWCMSAVMTGTRRDPHDLDDRDEMLELALARRYMRGGE